MQLMPYLNFQGDCEAAFRFYEQHLGGTVGADQNQGAARLRAAFRCMTVGGAIDRARIRMGTK